MKLFRTIGLGVFFLLSNVMTFAQPTVFTHLSSKDSLLQNSAYSITQDHHGFLWFATQVSVEVYDGRKFKHIEYRKGAENYLCETPVLCQDPIRNRMWLGTNLGLAWIDGSKFSLHLQDGLTDPLDTDVRFIVPNPNTDEFWVGTPSNVYRMHFNDGDNPVLERIFPQEDNPAGTINGITHAPGASLHIATDIGLFTLEGTKAENIAPAKVSFLAQEAGHKWVVMPGKGLFEFQQTLSLNIDTTTQINCILQRDNRLWIGTENQGLILYLATESGWKLAPPDSTSPLEESPVRSLYQSQDGVIWIGTRGNGIFAWSPLKPRFEHYYHREQIPEDHTQLLWAILPDPTHPRKLWLGTEGDGLAHFDLDAPQSVEYFPVGLPGAPLHTESQKVRCIVAQADYLWLGTRNGLYRFDPVTQQFSLPPAWPTESQPTPGIISLWLDEPTQKLWVGTLDQGLFTFDLQSQTWEWLLHPGGFPTVGDFNVSFIGPGVADGTVFVGTSYGFLTYNSARSKPVPTPAGDTLQLPGTYIRSVFFERPQDSLLWIGTSMKGLIRYNRFAETQRVYAPADGLPNKVIYGTMLDRNGDVWISTNVGITRFDRNKEIFINYGKSNGIQDYEFNSGAYHAQGDSVLYFGGVNGFNRISLPRQKTETEVPLALFARIGQESWEETLVLFDGDSLTLSGDYEYVKFRLAAMEFHDSDKQHFGFRFRRAGEETAWKNVLTDPYITLGKKGYGSWILEFRASDSFGTDWHTGSLQVEIERPLYLQWWVILPASFILLMGLLLGVGEYVRRRRLAKQDKAHRKNLDFLREIGSQLTFPAHRDVLVERLKEKVRGMVREDIFRSDLFLLGVFHPDSGQLEFEVLTEMRSPNTPYPELERAAQTLAQSHAHLPVETRKQPLALTGNEIEGPWVLTRPLVLNEGFENEKRLGVAAIVSRGAEKYTDNDSQIFGALGDYLSIALDNSQKINAEYSHELARSLQQALRSSLTEHFTKNLLAKAQGFVFRDDKKALLSFLSRMGKLIETAMRHSEKGLVSIREEVEYLKLYLELQQANLGPDRLQFRIEGQDLPALQTIQIPSMVVQTYVENAILHGVAGLPPSETGVVTIKWQLSTPGEKESDRYWCIIEDNGPGIGEDEPDGYKKQAHGMTLTQQRLQLLGEINDFDMTPKIEHIHTEAPRGTRVVLTFPLSISVDLDNDPAAITQNDQ